MSQYLRQAAEALLAKLDSDGEEITAEVQELRKAFDDQVTVGVSVTQGGKRIDPMSIYKEPEQASLQWQVTKGGAYTSGMYWVAERVDGKGWNAHKDSENLLLAHSLSQCKEACEQDARLQLEQEPVAMRYQFDGYGYKYIDMGCGSGWIEFAKRRFPDAEPVFAAPQQRKPLTDKQLMQIYLRTNGIEFYKSFARAIEAAHGIKGAA
jgi:hypothetical protein